MHLTTTLVRPGSAATDPWRASSPPIYQTATFAQESAEAFGRYDYARSGNPTRDELESHCARLEGGVAAFAYPSGVAALAAVARLLKPGDELLAHEDLYGGSHRLYSRVFGERGVRVRYVDLVRGTLDDWRRACSSATRLIAVESVTNPQLRVPDIRALARLARGHGCLLAVDATMLSPYLQRPLDLGAHLVVQSATKLLNGHADVTAGVVATSDAALAKELRFLQNAEGSVLGPFDAWLLLRGMRTLAVRIDRQQATAARVAAFLAERVASGDLLEVRYPGRPDHPDFERHRSQARGAGVVISFRTGDVARSVQVVEALRSFSIAVSFGSVASTASLPSCMSHASIPSAERLLDADLVRLSIGLEDPDDLMADLEQALRAASPHRARGLAPEALRDPQPAESS